MSINVAVDSMACGGCCTGGYSHLDRSIYPVGVRLRSPVARYSTLFRRLTPRDGEVLFVGTPLSSFESRILRVSRPCFSWAPLHHFSPSAAHAFASLLLSCGLLDINLNFPPAVSCHARAPAAQAHRGGGSARPGQGPPDRQNAQSVVLRRRHRRLCLRRCLQGGQGGDVCPSTDRRRGVRKRGGRPPPGHGPRRWRCRRRTRARAPGKR